MHALPPAHPTKAASQPAEQCEHGLGTCVAILTRELPCCRPALPLQARAAGIRCGDGAGAGGRANVPHLVAMGAMSLEECRRRCPGLQVGVPVCGKKGGVSVTQQLVAAVTCWQRMWRCVRRGWRSAGAAVGGCRWVGWAWWVDAVGVCMACCVIPTVIVIPTVGCAVLSW